VAFNVDTDDDVTVPGTNEVDPEAAAAACAPLTKPQTGECSLRDNASGEDGTGPPTVQPLECAP
jgi:hypothetical protein